jgi:hypothetical protein
MKKSEPSNQAGKFNAQEPLKFSFDLTKTQADLIDAYVGVDFSIVYKVTLSIKPRE